MEQEIKARYSNETRRAEELYHQESIRSVAAQEQMIAQSAVNVTHENSSEAAVQRSEAVVHRLCEELNLANMAQATASSNATESDRKLAEMYQEAHKAVQKIQEDSNQQNTLLRSELESSQQNYTIQGAKLQTHIRELSEQRLLSEKLSGEVKEQQHMLNEQRILFQEQTEQTRVLMTTVA